MTVIKAGDIARFTASDWRNYPVILVFGADEGSIRETADALVAAAAGPNPDPLDRIELEGDTIAQDPARLADELGAISMFGGQRVIHIRNVSRIPLAVVESAAEAAGPTPVILEAGELRPGTGLRALAEKHRSIAALACYADSARDLQTLIDRVLSASGHTITKGGRMALVAALGGDRSLSRSEIDKLVLYAGQTREIDAEIVAEIISDAGRHDVGPLIDHAFNGTLDVIEPEANRLFSAGINASGLLVQTQHHVLMLRRALRAREKDNDLFRFKKANRIHFSRSAAFDQATLRWNEARLDRCLRLVSDAVLNARKSARLGDPIAIRALWSVARLARGSDPSAQ